MPRGKAIRNKNGYGTVVKLSGNRRQPYEVRVNTRMDNDIIPSMTFWDAMRRVRRV